VSLYINKLTIKRFFGLKTTFVAFEGCIVKGYKLKNIKLELSGIVTLPDMMKKYMIAQPVRKLAV